MLQVHTGSRLHFGLVELAADQPWRFAGLGIMIDEPKVCIELDPSTEAEAPPHDVPERLQSAISKLSQYRHELVGFDHQRLVLSKSPQQHSGLGSGTQISCATVAAALLSLETNLEQDCLLADCLPELNPTELAQLSGRGLRSSIGLQGFLTGGLILDAGQQPGETPSNRKVDTQVTHLPNDWRVLVFRPAEAADIVCGQQETELISQVSSSPNPHSHEMWRAGKKAFESARTGSFGDFADHLERYLRSASRIFEPVQKGEFNGAELTQLAAIARELGLRAVGQSSWGPTLFGFCESEAQANELAESVAARSPFPTIIDIAIPSRHGARVRLRELPHQ